MAHFLIIGSRSDETVEGDAVSIEHGGTLIVAMQADRKGPRQIVRAYASGSWQKCCMVEAPIDGEFEEVAPLKSIDTEGDILPAKEA